MESACLILLTLLPLLIDSGVVKRFEFVAEPKSRVSVENEMVVFKCSAVSTPEVNITYFWKKDGVYMDTSKMTHVELNLNVSLVIKQLKTSDFGAYRCVAQCVDGAIISQPAKLVKAELSLSEARDAVDVDEGGYHLFKPTIVTNVAATVAWKMCNSYSCNAPDSSRSFITSDGSLLIAPILSSDNNHYPKLKVTGEYIGIREATFGKIEIDDYLPTHWKYRCPEAIFSFLPTKRNFTVLEGGTVSMSCLGVLKRCANPLSFSWKDKTGQLLSSTRKLRLTNVRKHDAGVYKCIAETSSADESLYYVHVIEKPRVLRPPPEVLALGFDGTVPSGVVENADIIEWYTNAEKILSTSSSIFYAFNANNSLQIKYHSAALGGIYQIVYRNRAGAVSRTIRVDVMNARCGGKITESNGKIVFWRPQNLPTLSTACLWLIQCSSPSPFELYFTRFSFKSDCSDTYILIYEGKNVHHFCSTSVPSGKITVSGPYVNIFVQGTGVDMMQGGFNIFYGQNITVPTTLITSTKIAATTVRPTTKKSTTASSTTKASTTTPTLATSTKTSTTTLAPSSSSSAWKSTTSNKKDTMKLLTTKSSITRVTGKSDKTKSKETRSKPWPETTTKITTLNTSHTVAPSKKKGSGKGSSPLIGAIVGICVAVVIIIIIFGIILCRRKKSFSFPMGLLSKYGSKGNLYERNLKKDDKSPSVEETCFTVKGQSRDSSTTKPFPDVIPRSDSRRIDTASMFIERNASGDNYTPLNTQYLHDFGNYTSLSFKEGNQNGEFPQGHAYAMIQPESERQYMPVSRSTSSHNGLCKTNSNVPTKDLVYPVYQELEVESDQVTSAAGYNEPCTTQPIYHVLEANDAVDSRKESSKGRKQHLQQQQQKQHDVQEYLQPSVSIKPRVSPKPNVKRASNSTNKTRTVDFTQSHYVQPNPVDENHKRGFSGKKLPNYVPPKTYDDCDSAVYANPYATLKNDGKTAAKEVAIRMYEPITSDDAAYLAIMR